MAKHSTGLQFVGWQDINESDLFVNSRDTSTAVMDIFPPEVPTLIIRCDVFDPITRAPYVRDPRGVAERASRRYLANTRHMQRCVILGKEV